MSNTLYKVVVFVGINAVFVALLAAPYLTVQ